MYVIECFALFHSYFVMFLSVNEEIGIRCIADLLNRLNCFNLRQINLNTKDGIFDGTLTIAVYDTDDVEALCSQLKQIENITDAVRV